MVPRLVVVSLWAENVSAMVHFYRDVVGLSLSEHHHDPPHFDLGGPSLVILKGKPLKPQHPEPDRFPILAFAVEDVDMETDRLLTNGIELPWGVEAGPGARYVMFNDPGGNLIEYVEFQ